MIWIYNIYLYDNTYITYIIHTYTFLHTQRMYVFVYYMDDDDDDDDDDVEVASLSPLPAARREAHFSGAVNWAGHEFG